MALDIIGREVNPGDLVAYNPPHYKGVEIGIVKKVNPKQFSVYIVKKQNNGTYLKMNYSHDRIASVALINDNTITIQGL